MSWLGGGCSSGLAAENEITASWSFTHCKVPQAGIIHQRMEFNLVQEMSFS
jgi:hypothetical protein